MECVEARLRRLERFEPEDDLDRVARTWVESELRPAWSRILGGVDRSACRGNISWLEPLPLPERSLSPSDFGFHNALLQDDGMVRFVDFEYAGWDDPAKLVNDFFCQPAVPVPQLWYPWFAERVASEFPDPPWHLRRMELLFPVYSVKWCCILLNVFLPVGRARRRFASSEFELSKAKAVQLRKAREALGKLDSPKDPSSRFPMRHRSPPGGLETEGLAFAVSQGLPPQKRKIQ